MLSLFIPVYNEEPILRQTTETLLEYVTERGWETEIIIGSNGSTDGTDALGNLLAEEYEQVRFFLTPLRGPGHSFKEGVRAARFDNVITLDADLSSDLVFLDYAHDLLSYADIIIGSKTLGRQRRSPVRVLGSQLYILFTNLFFDLTVSDYSLGCKAFRKKPFLSILDNLDPWTGYIFELCVYARIHNLSLLQVGIECDDQRESHFNLLHEGIYRYRQLYSCWKLLRKGGSWIQSPPAKE